MLAPEAAHDPGLPPARRRPHRPPHAARVHVQRQALRGPRRRHARLRAARQRRAAWSRGAGSITGRAASSPAAWRSPTRSCSSKPAPATVPNARATEVELYDGLVANSVNAWPSVDFDVMAFAGLFARFMPAGFYYKTFMWPRSFWMKYEHFIRKASGLGTAPTAPDPDHYDRMNAHCDVLVVGGGPAGLAAALGGGQGRRARHPRRRAERIRRQPAVASRRRGRRRGSGGRRLDRRRDADGVGDADRRPAADDARGAAPAAQHRVRLSRPQLPDHRRAPHRSSAAGRAQGAARARVARAREAGRAGDGRDRTPARLRQQRPAGRDAGLGGVHVS